MGLTPSKTADRCKRCCGLATQDAVPPAGEHRISPEAGNLAYPVTKDDLAAARYLVQHLQDGQSIQNVLHAKWPEESTPDFSAQSSKQEPPKSKLVIYTDLEPDDIMAVAQLWQWKVEHGNTVGAPLIIFHANLRSKDGGTILEKKQLMARLMLGLEGCHTLTFTGDIGNCFFEKTGEIHPQALHLAQARQDTLKAIAEELTSFEGSLIEFYVMAPGHGNLGDIVAALKSSGKWPLVPKWQVTIYSGSYNMRSMSDGDIAALEAIMEHTDVPLVDIGKFPLFGGKDCHEWTDSLTTFADKRFAHHLCKKSPLLAAVMVSFNDEFNEGLINPVHNPPAKLFKGSDLTTEEAARFEAISSAYQAQIHAGNDTAIRVYAKAVVRDEALFAKIVNFKKSTFKAFAYGGCDSPLCDQLIFLYEWMRAKSPGSLVAEPGTWFFDKGAGFTTIKKDGSGKFPAIQPVLKNPKNEDLLLKLRRELSGYILKHLRSVDCHIHRNAGHLKYDLSAEALSEAEEAVKKLHEGNALHDVLPNYAGGWKAVPQREPKEPADKLLFVYTDLEPDDVMAIAQLRQLKAKQNFEDLIVFHANFESKDGGNVFEKKQLVTALMLGESVLETALTHEGDEGDVKWERDGTVHPQQQALVDARQDNLERICAHLRSVKHLIDFNILAPGKGNLGAIVKKLKQMSAWPLQAKWQVFMYSGGFNTRGMKDADLEALAEIMQCSGSHLVDIGKFPFFGGKDCHAWTDSLSTFVMPTFAGQLTRKYPELAAMLQLFNDEFNEGLINPKSKSLFKGSTLDDDEQKRFEQIKAKFQSGNHDALKDYAFALVSDEKLFAKVANFKKSTLKCFAYGGCDSPLCDQLVFLYQWLNKRGDHSMDAKVGTWHVDLDKGITSVKQDGTGRFPASQPVLRNPHDEAQFIDMRLAMETHLLDHLSSHAREWGRLEAGGPSSRWTQSERDSVENSVATDPD